MRPRRAGAALALGAAATASSAWAAGGADIVDDATVETAGGCHVESWITLGSGHSRLANLDMGCTPRAPSNLELGAFVTHSWNREAVDTVIGVAPKLVLRSEHRGLGIAVSASLGYGVERSRLQTAAVTLPVTIPLSPTLRASVNVGRQWSGLTHHNNLFLGGQTEIALSRKLNLMAEVFAIDHGEAGAQLGLRWTPGKGHVDIDLKAGRYVDGATRNALTLGLIVRP